jgi:hypothetical protein
MTNNLQTEQNQLLNTKITHKTNINKKTKYAKERSEFIEKINKLIGISETTNFVYLYDLENNDNLKNEMVNISNDIKKYYKCGHWGYFSKEKLRGMGNIISLIRCVYKDDDFLITTKKKNIERNNNKINSTVYFITKNKGFY